MTHSYLKNLSLALALALIPRPIPLPVPTKNALEARQQRYFREIVWQRKMGATGFNSFGPWFDVAGRISSYSQPTPLNGRYLSMNAESSGDQKISHPICESFTRKAAYKATQFRTLFNLGFIQEI